MVGWPIAAAGGLFVWAALGAQLDPAVALARVLVHEIRHLLAPTLPHSDLTAMQSALRTDNVWVPRYTNEQAAAIRATVDQRQRAASGEPLIARGGGRR